MATPIRTPDDEINTPGYYYPPFMPGDWYQGQTYGGHSDFSVDWNKRTKNGGWLEDRGEPVLAQADGTVVSVNKTDGVVLINHWGGKYRTESRHMGRILVRVGEKVKRGDKIGEIGSNGINPADVPGGIVSAHLHVVHWRKVKGAWKRAKQSYLGVDVISSVWNSDSIPKGTDMPGPVMLQGQPLPVTWEDAYNEAVRRLAKRDATLASVRGSLTTALAKIAELEAAAQAPNDEVKALKDALAAINTIVDPLLDDAQ